MPRACRSPAVAVGPCAGRWPAGHHPACQYDVWPDYNLVYLRIDAWAQGATPTTATLPAALGTRRVYGRRNTRAQGVASTVDGRHGSRDYARLRTLGSPSIIVIAARM
ncbi:hypothetical protein BH24CHL4_BH24CHL4_12550 [soil metagenome]